MRAVQKYCNLMPAISNRDSIDNNLPFSYNDSLSYSVDWLIYGSSGHGRFATLKYHNYSDEPFYDFSDPGSTFTRLLYNKEYELKDHLGNVRLVFSDLKLRTNDTKFDLDLRAVNNYYPFGMLQPGRYWQSGDYRYGFNGMGRDDEIKGVGNSLDFGARIYDSRLGRWLSRDPLKEKYTSLSPYSFAADNPIKIIDKDGEDIYIIDQNVSTRTALDILSLTEEGRNLLSYYENSPDEDLYISSARFPSGPGDIMLYAAIAVHNIKSLGAIKNGVVDFNNKNWDYVDKMSIFNGLDLTKSTRKTVSLISLNQQRFLTNGNVPQCFFLSDLYYYLSNAEMIYHEMNSHIKYDQGSKDKDHEVYGKSTYGIYTKWLGFFPIGDKPQAKPSDIIEYQLKRLDPLEIQDIINSNNFFYGPFPEKYSLPNGNNNKKPSDKPPPSEGGNENKPDDKKNG